MQSKYIYKLVAEGEWSKFRQSGVYYGSDFDRRDGFIHFSDAHQLGETARKHFFGVHDLVLLAVDPRPLGVDLKYEVSRGGALFPHLYASLPIRAVVWDRPVMLDRDGCPVVEAALAAGSGPLGIS